MSCRRTSPVWKVFERVDGSSARCRLCNHPYSTSGSTSNLRDRIRRRHPDSVSDDGQIRGTVRRQDLPVFQYRGGTELQGDDIPHQSTIPAAKSSNSVKRSDPGAPGGLQEKLREALVGARWVTLTTNILTSNRQQRFVEVTIHFVNSGKLTSGCLDAAMLQGGHSAGNIAAQLQGVMDAWQIVGKVVAIVADNASHMKAAIRSLEIPHLPCMAHTLRLVVCGAITLVQRLVEIFAKCGDIVVFLSTAPWLPIASAINKTRHKLQSCGLSSRSQPAGIASWQW